MNTPQKIELHECFFFDCDECGREVIIRPNLISFDQIMAQDDADAADEEYVEMLRSVFEAEGGLIPDKPQFVTCPHCDTSFEVEENY